MTVEVVEIAHRPRTPAEKAESFALCIRSQSNALAMQFGGPLYLVGSMLTSHEPGDVDMRLYLLREELVAYFGEEWDHGGMDTKPAWFRRKREELKQSRRLCRTFTNRDKWPRFDFQFQLYGESGEPIHSHADRPRIRLDFFRAGLGDP